MPPLKHTMSCHQYEVTTSIEFSGSVLLFRDFDGTVHLKEENQRRQAINNEMANKIQVLTKKLWKLRR